jgi:eukaryotic-like serine/threonine-protein kinase
MTRSIPSNASPQRRMLNDSPVETLRRAWQEGREPALDTFVAGLTDVSPGDLAALIRADLDARWSRNDRQRPEEYLRRFAAVAADAELAVDVIYAEYFARELSGEKPELAEYQARFPEFAQVLAEQIRLHHAFDMLDDDGVQLPPTDADPTHRCSPQPPGGVSEADASYEILEQIGSGGMGVVYKARQPALNRFVALKMVRAIDASNRELLARFRSEAHVVASLHHPHIVQVHDYGEHDGLPYIAMELVEGGSLADRLDGTPWAPRAAVALLIKLSDAVQFAHQRHVIHRDLKPANVLVVSDEYELEVKITDFGLAKFLAEESSQHTKSYAFIGTPSYMAPEQANGRASEIGPAADIYSLGAIFCELLTGQPPLRGETPIETLRLLLSAEPVSIQQFAPGIPRDLATICEKCLQCEPNRRFASAAELREDLNRYLEGRPIQARPVGNAERARRWCRRNPLLAGAFGSVALLLAGIAAVSLWYSAQLSRELADKRLAEKSAQGRLWDSYLSEAMARNSSHQVGQRFAALDTIDKAVALLDTVGRSAERERQLRSAVLSSVALPDLREVRSFGARPATPFACDMTTTADCYAVADLDGTIGGFRLSDGRRLWTIKHSEAEARPIISRDGRFVATVGDRGTKVWRVDGPEPQAIWEATGAQFFTFAPDGQYAAYSTQNDGMRLVHVSTGQTVRRIGSGSARSKFSFDPRTGRIAVCGAASIQVIAGDTGKVEVELPQGDSVGPLVAWRPGGEYLAAWTDANEIVLWNMKSRAKEYTLPHVGMPAQLSFNRDGSILATQSLWNERLLVWDVGTAQCLLDVPGFVSHACDLGPEGRILILSLHVGDAVLSELTAGACAALAQTLHAPLGLWGTVSVSPEGRIVAFSGAKGLELWDSRTRRRLLNRTVGPCSADFDDAGRLVLGCNSGIYRLSRRVETIASPTADPAAAAKSTRARTVVQFGPAEQLTGSIEPSSLAVNASGESLVVQGTSDWFVMHSGKDSARIRLEPKPDPRKSAVSDDNRFAAIVGWEIGGATVWNARSGAKLADLGVGRYGVLKFSPDGQYLAATPDGVTLWRTRDWRRTSQLQSEGTTPTGLGIAFSPDSRVLAVGQINGVVTLVDPHTGDEWARLSERGLNVASIMSFSPDQRWLITSSVDQRSPAQVWDLTAMRRALRDRGLDWPADVLRAGTSEQSFEEQIDIVLDDVGLLDGSPQPSVQETPQPSQNSR